MSETLDEAVRRAKVEAGLDPDKKYEPILFFSYIGPECEKEFWDQQINTCLNGALAELDREQETK